MRAIVIVPLLFAAACGGGSESEKNAAQPRAESLAAGMWELTSEVTTLQALDDGSPRIDTPVGTRTTASVCVGSGRPPTAFFAGEGYTCVYDRYYVRGSRLNVTLRCTGEGLPGSISILAEGRFEAESLEFQRHLSTALSGSGDVRIISRVTGRRTGDCPAGDPEGNQAGDQAAE